MYLQQPVVVADDLQHPDRELSASAADKDKAQPAASQPLTNSNAPLTAPTSDADSHKQMTQQPDQSGTPAPASEVSPPPETSAMSSTADDSWRPRLPVQQPPASEAADFDLVQGFCYAMSPARLAIQQPPRLRVHSELLRMQRPVSDADDAVSASPSMQDGRAEADARGSSNVAVHQQEEAAQGESLMGDWR